MNSDEIPVGIVSRMAQQHEPPPPPSGVAMDAQKLAQDVQQMAQDVDNHIILQASPSNAAVSVGRDAATIHRVKLAKGKRRAKMAAAAANGGLPSGLSSVSSVTDKYTSSPIKADDASSSANISLGGGDKSTATSNNSSYHIGLPSLLTDGDDMTIESYNEHHEIMETTLYQKFEDAFNITLRNNPGMLPGAPTVIDSIKQSLYKVQQTKLKKEKEMRKQLDKVKAEKDAMEQQLRKQMGSAALRKNELAKELDTAKSDKDLLSDSLAKQTAAINAVKEELKSKMSDVTKEKEELSKHLGFLSKSRAELEKALEVEMKAVEKDRDALKDIVAERKKLQKQKNENKALESKIERMTQAASKEKKALQSEVTELKKFEEHVSKLRSAHDTSRRELEAEKKKLKEMAGTMQTKKSMLMESLKDLETQYKQEIEELEAQIESSKLLHERNMETVVKKKVMRYLGRDGPPGGDARTPNTPQETDLKDKSEMDIDDELLPKENRYGNMKEGRMRREIDRLREELEIVGGGTPRTPRVLDAREDIGTFRERDEMKYSTPSTPGRRSMLRGRDALISPRYGLESVGLSGGYGGEAGRYSEDSEDDLRYPGGGGSRSYHHLSRHHMAPPLSQRSPRTVGRRSLGGERRRNYYFN